MKTVYSLKDLKDKLSANIGHVDLPHDEHMVTIWQKNKDTFLFGNNSGEYYATNNYFLEFNGKFIKSGKTLKPILNKLQTLDLKVE